MSHISLFFLLALLLPAALGACTAKTFEDAYNAAKTVVKAKVVRVSISPTPTPLPCLTAIPPCLPPIFLPQSVKYRLKLRRTYKGCAPNKKFFGKSFESIAACGQRLVKGKIYMLNLGTETPDLGGQPDSFSISMLQGNRLFSSLTRAQKRFLARSSRLPENQCMMP